MSDDKKIVLNMSEDNEISFGLSIEGYSSDASLASNPKVRFALTENEEKLGFILPAKFEQGQVSIKIPSSTIYREGKEYTGVLEVLLGNRYFKPAEIQIEFHKPLDVKANLVSEGAEVKEVTTTSQIQVKRTPTPKREPEPTTKPKTVVKEQVKKLDVMEELQELLAEEERLKRLLEAKIKASKSTNQSSQSVKEKALKQKLKKLFKESLD